MRRRRPFRGMGLVVADLGGKAPSGLLAAVRRARGLVDGAERRRRGVGEARPCPRQPPVDRPAQQTRITRLPVSGGQGVLLWQARSLRAIAVPEHPGASALFQPGHD
jgi:hypothetical protein